MRSLLLIASLLASGVLMAQQQFKVQQADSSRPRNYWIADLTKGSKKLAATDTLKLIVRLQGSPVPTRGGRQSLNIFEQHQQFKADLTRLTGGTGRTNNGSTPHASIRYEYSKTFNGFAVTTSRALADDIRKLSYVASVTEDKKVEASYSENIQTIRAPQAWQDFGVTGKNITIGILDTGIDYNHPDLGQGFGAGFKVAGGYDFVNEDEDPMDDHGHGTHVAGIAAANGVDFKGVAPDARLFAYKVLNNYGNGYDSWILAAIERCVDPDQNPETDDALDVVNMSLGRPPDGAEPLSEAVNNAVAQGVVFCIAAGNRGDYLTVDTPGTAENAITVGATDNYKNTAFFSSKGPTEELLFKPDVSAPGMDINSTFLNQSYQVNSGTSMATPHVAGAVALLLEKRPDFTPEMVKGALMGTAESNSYLPWDQGSGVIDVYDAINNNFLVTPGSLNFAADTFSTFDRTLILTVANLDDDSRTFDLSASGPITSIPFSLSISPQSFSLNAHETRTVQVRLTAASPIPLTNLPEAFSGIIEVYSGGMVTKTPVVLFNPQKTVIEFTGELPNNVIVVGIEGSWYWRPYYPPPGETSIQLYLPRAKYDLITQYEGGLRTIVTESVNTSENVQITLDKSMAKNLLAFKPLDLDGNPIDLSSFTSGGAFFSGQDRNIVTIFTGPVDTLYVSDMEHYKYEFNYTGLSASGNEFFDIVAGTETGISENQLCVNNPATFSRISIRNPSVAEGGLQNVTFYAKSGAPGFWSTSWNSYPYQLPATFTLLQTQRNLSSGYLGAFIRFSPLPEEPGYVWETADIRAEEGGNISFYQHIDRKIATVEQPDLDYTLGGTIPNFFMNPAHQSSLVSYYSFFGRGAFIHGLGERERGLVTFRLYNDASVIRQGIIKQAIYTESESIFSDVEVVPGTYHLDFEYRDFQTGGKFGVARFSTVFNTAGYDPNPPILKSVRILADGMDTNEYPQGRTATLNFRIAECEFCDYAYLQSTSALIKHSDDENWSSLDLASSANGEFSAELPQDLRAGYYTLQLTATDVSGNKFTYEVAPAFLIGDRLEPVPYSTINLIAPKNYSVSAGTNPQFRWSDAGLESYLIQISHDPDFNDTELESTASQASYSLTEPLEQDKTFYWRVKGLGENSSGLWSSVFQFESSFLPVATLLSPMHESTVPFAPVDFSWTPVPQAYSYTFELSRNSDFSTFEWFEYTDQTLVSTTGLYPNTKYYWRVRARFFFGWEEEVSVSPTFEFNVESIPVPLLLHPADGSSDQPLHLAFDWQPSESASGYNLEVSRQADFSSIDYSLATSGTALSISNLEPETAYYWRVTPRYNDIPQRASATNTFRTATVTSIEQSVETQQAYAFPNPFSGGTNIVIVSDAVDNVTIQITDPLGRTIKNFSYTIQSGMNIIHWDDGATDQPSRPGIYYAMIVRKTEPNLAVRLVKTK